MKADYRDLFLRDQQRLAGWPPRFRGEGPFLPTGRRKPGRKLAVALTAVLLVVCALFAAQWAQGGGRRSLNQVGANARTTASPVAAGPAASSDPHLTK